MSLWDVYQFHKKQWLNALQDVLNINKVTFMMILSVVYFTFIFRRSAGRGRASDRESTSPRRPLTSAHGPIGTGPERCPLLAESLWTLALLPPPPPPPPPTCFLGGGGEGYFKNTFDNAALIMSRRTDVLLRPAGRFLPVDWRRPEISSAYHTLVFCRLLAMQCISSVVVF